MLCVLSGKRGRHPVRLQAIQVEYVYPGETRYPSSVILLPW